MAQSPSSSAQAARKRVAGKLRDLVLDAGITSQELSERCGWSPSKTSRLQHALAAPSDSDIRAWCVACGVPDDAEDLIAANRQADQLYTEWRKLNRSGLLLKQQDILSLVERAHVQRVYCSNVIPGFLQTAEYATALLSAITCFQGTPDDVEESVRERLKRRRALYSGGAGSLCCWKSLFSGTGSVESM